MRDSGKEELTRPSLEEEEAESELGASDLGKGTFVACRIRISTAKIPFPVLRGMRRNEAELLGPKRHARARTHPFVGTT